MKIKSEEVYLKSLVEKLSSFKLFSCQEIMLVLNHKGSQIQGTSVKYYHSKDGFYLTYKWYHPLERYSISHQLAAILKCEGLEREVQLLLELKEHEILQYLDLTNLSISSIVDFEVFQEIQIHISELRSLLTSTPPKLTDPDPSIAGISPVSPLSPPVKTSIMSEDEIQELKSLLDGSLSDDQMFDENLAAHVKALFYFENSGCDVSQARLSFKENLSSKTLGPIIGSDGRRFTVMCRSARSGLLFLGAYAWLQLRKSEIKLYILTGSIFTDCKICENTEDLDEANSIFWVIRREADQNYPNLESILKSDNDVKKMQLIYRMDAGQYKSIFETFGSDSLAVRTGGVIDDEI
ncbi:hypothetical protein [Dyadobacter psychrophilus]|uniref:Uncharacterized protein n=1 Tax=Dyadobacter psychrophilus TaxID=651661 RepID=A0A1T5DCX0_9BACT|nr:hypothetical protein [Dyadobacter psychrophilus]SKB69602.1 hypothetical protein SAMN05660293_01537 [Dyadobacter psychrophilus]